MEAKLVLLYSQMVPDMIHIGSVRVSEPVGEHLIKTTGFTWGDRREGMACKAQLRSMLEQYGFTNVDESELPGWLKEGAEC